MFHRTSRLLLRPGWAEDAAALAATIAHESVAMKLARLPWPYDRAHAEQWLARPQGPHDAAFLVYRRTAGMPELIGGCGFHAHDGDAPELGYWIAPDHWGRGYATEAARALVEIARGLRLPRLVSSHFTDNPASGRVLRKIGFTPTGEVAPRLCLASGETRPAALYAMELALPLPIAA